MFYILWFGYLIYRFCELSFSKRNDKELLKTEHELGKNQKKIMLLLHSLWFLCLLIEYQFRGKNEFYLTGLNLFLVSILCICFFLRLKSMIDLKHRWSTRIFTISKDQIVTSGIYSYLKHPSYIAAFSELTCLPLLFNLFTTSIIFTFANGIFLYFRIKLENYVLEGGS